MNILAIVLIGQIVMFLVQALQYRQAMKNFLNQTEAAIVHKKDYDSNSERLKREMKQLKIEREEFYEYKKAFHESNIIYSVSAKTKKRK